MGSDVIDPGDVFLDAEHPDEIEAWQRYVDELDAYSNNMRDYIDSFGEPYMTLKDGSIISLVPIGLASGEGGRVCFVFHTYFDIGELYSITFCGEAYIFDSAAG